MKSHASIDLVQKKDMLSSNLSTSSSQTRFFDCRAKLATTECNEQRAHHELQPHRTGTQSGTLQKTNLRPSTRDVQKWYGEEEEGEGEERGRTQSLQNSALFPQQGGEPCPWKVPKPLAWVTTGYAIHMAKTLCISNLFWLERQRTSPRVRLEPVLNAEPPRQHASLHQFDWKQSGRCMCISKRSLSVSSGIQKTSTALLTKSSGMRFDCDSKSRICPSKAWAIAGIAPRNGRISLLHSPLPPKRDSRCGVYCV